MAGKFLIKAETAMQQKNVGKLNKQMTAKQRWIIVIIVICKE